MRIIRLSLVVLVLGLTLGVAEAAYQYRVGQIVFINDPVRKMWNVPALIEAVSADGNSYVVNPWFHVNGSQKAWFIEPENYLSPTGGKGK